MSRFVSHIESETLEKMETLGQQLADLLKVAKSLEARVADLEKKTQSITTKDMPHEPAVPTR